MEIAENERAVKVDTNEIAPDDPANPPRSLSAI
jgi:hypothetical protein